MPEPSDARMPIRPFPWFCPKCRRKEVRRTTIAYECQRLRAGQPLSVAVPNLAVPRCGYCGELVFDADAEAQINRAYEAHIHSLMSDGKGQKDQPAPPVVPTT